MRLRAAWVLVLPFLYFARPTTTSLFVGGGVIVLGLLIRGWAAGQLEKNKELTTSGPYAHSRNPLYLGSFLIGLGATVAGGQLLFVALFVGFFGLVYGRTMDQEREHLTELFGERYEHYRAGVPLFFPRPLPYRPPDGWGTPGRFSVDRYMRNKEWEALIGAAAGVLALVLKAVLSSTV